MKIRAVGMLLLIVWLAGCSGPQSALDAQGHSASVLKDVIIFIVSACTVIWLLVVVVLVWSLMRRSQAANLDDGNPDRKLKGAVWSAIVATALVVSGFTAVSFYATRGLGDGSGDIVVRVKAQQWWWQFVYQDAGQGQVFQTANELHIPVGRDVRLELESIDVIHSLWVPSLAGKQDLIPGRLNVLTLRADRVGIYRGQCAEFCGLQHSHMAVLVVAENDEDYRRWTQAQRQGAVDPPAGEAEAGKAVFLKKPCAACHTIRGTPASGTSGPDLTHVGSRRTIGAGLLETTRGALAAWIADPQTLKPGNNMPIVPLTSDELRQLSAYMESLK